jgi:hypothetical protein
MTEQLRGISRRGFLRAAGASVALPLLPSLSLQASAAPTAAPLRLLFVFTPNGMHMPDWTPAKTGVGYTMPRSLAALERHRDKLLVLSGLDLDAGHAHGDGPGDHARAGATFLTGMHPVKTPGANIRVGVSVDQLAARSLGGATRFPSLELGTERSRQSGSCDSGYACAYSSNISWRSPTAPNAKEIVPQRVFDRLFAASDGLSDAERRRRAATRGSILDAVLEQAKGLRARLGVTDRRKLEEYMGSLREVEKRVRASAEPEVSPAAGYSPPKGRPRSMQAHIRAMYDLVRLAFETDRTRVATFMVGNAGSNRSYRFLGVPEGHHRLSHHGRSAEKQAKIATINRFHVEQFSYLLDELDKVREGDGSLLDNTLVVFGSAIGDGNRHNHDQLPILLAGGGRGRVKGGRHLRFEPGTPLCSLYLRLLRFAGSRARSFGDATAPLARLA